MSKSGGPVFYRSFIVALLVSLSSTLFCVISGAGAILDLLGACSSILLVGGAVISPWSLKRGNLISLLGVGACALVLLVIAGELIDAIPFNRQPRQAAMIYIPIVLLGLLLMHLSSVLSRLREARNAELLASLRGKRL
jgi:hypothetical protein